MDIYSPTLEELRVLEMRAQADTSSPRRDGPVLMADCTTPLAGETLLSLLWKRWDRED
ncbi:MAG: hypothetical protein JJ869_08585 [Marivita sp.]|uniref:hypothetical protein n=1 Tax=Marivita sp. TaxID=2003365 RepID=UPI001B284513|nr:hypothetical protein [Marivita sp.]MBO6883623.1 hypothetical protein [Marivita sp.]